MRTLFKYLSDPRDFFENGFIRLSQISCLNDPFEASFCQQSLDELCTYFDKSTEFFESKELSFSEYVRANIFRVGVISLTENKENLLMWAHYADEHRGVVAGITQINHSKYFPNIFDDLFDPINVTTSLKNTVDIYDGVARPVSYRKGLRYKNDKFDYDYSNIDGQGAERLLYEVLMQKSDEWIYEQEHRIILRLEQADRVILPSLNYIKNQKIVSVLKQYSCVAESKCNSSQHKKCVIDLFRLRDVGMRTAVSKELAKLGNDPSIIYLMKIEPSYLSSCLLGVNSTLEVENIKCKHASSVGVFEFWKAQKNLDYYSLDFVELE